MLKLTITNVDKSTADVLTYIAKKAGGKVTNTKDVQLKDKSNLVDENILDIRAQRDNVIKMINENYAKGSKTKVK